MHTSDKIQVCGMTNSRTGENERYRKLNIYNRAERVSDAGQQFETSRDRSV